MYKTEESSCLPLSPELKRFAILNQPDFLSQRIQNVWHNLTHSSCPTTFLPTPYTYLFLYSGQHLQSPRNSYTHYHLYTLVPIVLFPKITLLLPKRYSSFKTQLMASLLWATQDTPSITDVCAIQLGTTIGTQFHLINVIINMLVFSWKLVLRKILSLRGGMNAMVDQKYVSASKFSK